jgi:hypothetical protein
MFSFRGEIIATMRYEPLGVHPVASPERARTCRRTSFSVVPSRAAISVSDAPAARPFARLASRAVVQMNAPFCRVIAHHPPWLPIARDYPERTLPRPTAAPVGDFVYEAFDADRLYGKALEEKCIFLPEPFPENGILNLATTIPNLANRPKNRTVEKTVTSSRRLSVRMHPVATSLADVEGNAVGPRNGVNVEPPAIRN